MLEFYRQFFYFYFCMVQETYLKLSVTESDFLENIFCPKTWVVDEDSQKLKLDQKILGVGMVKNGVANLVTGL